MKKRLHLVTCLLLAWMLVSACATSSQQGQEPFPEVTQYFGPATAAPTNTPAPAPVSTPEAGTESIFSANPYDVPVDPSGQTDEGATQEDSFSMEDIAAEEEANVSEFASWDASGSAQMVVEGTPYPYAGSTPIPLDPVDMPPKTLQPVNFTNTQYAIALGVSFEAPGGWKADETIAQTFILSEPEAQMKDNQLGEITITAVPVAENMGQSALESHVKDRLDDLSATNFSEWKPSYTATRYLMGTEGVYANYTGTIVDGTQVGGRIHYVCINNVLYGLEIRYPLDYQEAFMGVFGDIRSSMKIS